MQERDSSLFDEVGGEDVDGKVEQEDESLHREGFLFHQLGNCTI